MYVKGSQILKHTIKIDILICLSAANVIQFVNMTVKSLK